MSWIKLEWSEERPPNDECHYNHVIAESPFGRFLITWKGWKDYPNPTIDESPWGYAGCGYDVAEAKQIAELEFHKRLQQCISTTEIIYDV